MSELSGDVCGNESPLRNAKTCDLQLEHDGPCVAADGEWWVCVYQRGDDWPDLLEESE